MNVGARIIRRFTSIYSCSRPFFMLKPEHQLIPYQASALPTGPWLVFAPHADDETFGMGGSLLKAHQENIETHVVVLTDGALGGDGDDLVETRLEEVKKATDLLGVSSLQCWNEPDRGLELSPVLVKRILACLHEIKPASVFFPGPMELHPDHRATTQLVWNALQDYFADATDVTAFAYEISMQNPANILIDISAEMPVKEQAMAIYASQNSQNNYPEVIRAGNVGRTFTLPPEVSFAEAFYRFDKSELARSLEEVVLEIVRRYF